MKIRSRYLVPLGILVYFLLCMVPSSQAQLPVLPAPAPFQMGISWPALTAGSGSLGAFNVTGFRYFSIDWVVNGAVGCTVTLDGNTGVGGSYSTGSIISSQTCASSGNFTTSSAVENAHAQLSYTVSGTGSVTFTVRGYANNPTTSSSVSGSVIATQSSGSNLHVNVDNNGATAAGALTSASSSSCTGAAGANGIAVSTIGAGSVGINILISGATNNTVLGFYYSMDGTNYIAVPSNVVFPKGGGASVTGTATGITAGSTLQFEASLGNAASFMVCGPTTASATATVTLQASLAATGIGAENLLLNGVPILSVGGPGAVQVLPSMPVPTNAGGSLQGLTQVKFTTNAGTVAGAVIKNASGNFYSVTINNPNASICFLEIFNATTGQVPGTAVANIVIPATSSFTFSLIPYSENFATGIAFTGATAADGATGCTSAMTGTAYIR